MNFKDKIRLCTLVAITIVTINSCKKENDLTPPFLGYSYFPQEEGKTLYYQVDSIGWLGYTYDPINQTVEIDTVSYQIKEVNEGFYTDAAGRQTARIVRYKRNTPADAWVVHKVIASNITSSAAERYEDNVRYFKLVFPPRENEKWIGQSINPILNDTLFEDWEYEYSAVNVPLSINNFVFDSTLTVIQKEDVNLIQFRNYFEQYATGYGMVYKEYNDWEYASTTSSFIKNGFIYKETIISQ
jgi:hypothetical protein